MRIRRVGDGLDDAVGGHQLLDPGDTIVVGLDDGGFFRPAGFDGIRIDGALPENPMTVQQVMRFDDAFLHADKFLADDLALFFRIADGGEWPKKLLLDALY